MEWILAHRSWLQYSAIVLATLISARFGAGPERLSSLTLLLMVVVELAYHLLFDAMVVVHKMDVAHVIMDLGALTAFYAIALSANRMYPLWLASLQTISVLYHLAREVVTTGTGLAYQVLSIGPSYLMTAIVYAGIIAHCLRKARYGRYRSWRWSQPRTAEAVHEQLGPDVRTHGDPA